MTQRRSKESVRAAKKPAAKKARKSPAREKKRERNSGNFKPGNELWRRALHARRQYNTPEELWAAAQAYFEWALANALREERAQLWAAAGKYVRDHANKLRAFTIAGFCLHAGVSREWFYSVSKTSPEFKDVIELIRDVIWEQKFTAAAAGLLDVSIISRELNLAETTNNRNLNTNLNGDDKAPEDLKAHLELFNQVLEKAV